MFVFQLAFYDDFNVTGSLSFFFSCNSFLLLVNKHLLTYLLKNEFLNFFLKPLMDVEFLMSEGILFYILTPL